jgi:hypothetical protein
MNWMFLLWIIIGLVGGIAAVVFYGKRQWRSGTRRMYEKLSAGRRSVSPETYNPEESAGLPEPVKRYFEAVLEPGQPLIAAVEVAHVGTFNMGEDQPQWKPFRSHQRVVMQQPGFVWDARIALGPGLSVRVHDAYLAGEGVLIASLLGLVRVLKMGSSPELAHGELLRFFAEAAWYPTALLPSQGVQWEPVDDTSARATLTDGGTTVTALFCFNPEGLIESVRAEDRGRAVENEMIPTPWEGRWRKYETRNGMRVPIEGEVAWMFPDGPKPYWRGRITDITYEFAE